MYKIKLLCVDTQHGRKIEKQDVYWDWGIGTYETREEALLSAYGSALQEASGLMENSDYNNWYEVSDCGNEHFEIEEFVEDIVFDIDVTWYSNAPWDRENDCDIQLLTGYKIVDLDEEEEKLLDEEKEKFNQKLRERHGEKITVSIDYYTEDDDSIQWLCVSARFGDSDNTWDTAEEAYEQADKYLCGLGELW